MTSPAGYAQGYNSNKEVMGVAKHFLVGFKADLQEETHAWYCKSDQEPTVGELTGPRDEPATIIELNGHCIKLLSKFISLPCR